MPGELKKPPCGGWLDGEREASLPPGLLKVRILIGAAARAYSASLSPTNQAKLTILAAGCLADTAIRVWSVLVDR